MEAEMMVGGKDKGQETIHSTVKRSDGSPDLVCDELAPRPDELAQFLEHATASDEDLFA
jgi:hypothetical protein